MWVYRLGTTPRAITRAWRRNIRCTTSLVMSGPLLPLLLLAIPALVGVCVVLVGLVSLFLPDPAARVAPTRPIEHARTPVAVAPRPQPIRPHVIESVPPAPVVPARRVAQPLRRAHVGGDFSDDGPTTVFAGCTR